jgi:hypothetical protein
MTNTEYSKKYYQEHKEEIKSKNKKYKQEHKEEVKQYEQKYTENNKEKRKEYMKEYYKEHSDEYRNRAQIWKKENKEKNNEYARKWKRYNKDKCSIMQKEWRLQHPEKIKEYNEKYKDDKKEINRYLRNQALEIIAKHHNSEVKCWRCFEDKLWCLTIGHVNQDGKEDRKKTGAGNILYKKIISGERKCDDLKIECMNCNSCLQWHGKYPDEIKKDEFLNKTKT